MKADTKKTDATVVEDGVAVTRDYNYGTWKKQEGWKPKLIVGAEGCNFTDSEGNTYLDFSSQLMCSNLGHGNRKVIDAIAEQARTLPYISPEFTTAARVELTKKLLEVLPDNLVKFFYGTSGAEANEAAVKIARMFFRKEGKFKIITRYDSYHGSTAASIGDVRGVGMFWAVELVKNRDTKEPFNTREDKLEGRQTVAGKVSQEMMKRGVYVNSWITHLTIAPPLIVTKEEIDHGIEVLDESLAVSDSLAGR